MKSKTNYIFVLIYTVANICFTFGHEFNSQLVYHGHKEIGDVNVSYSYVNVVPHVGYELQLTADFISKEINVNNGPGCAANCSQSESCASANFYGDTNTCQVLLSDRFTHYNKFVTASTTNTIHYAIKSECEFNPCINKDDLCEPNYVENTYKCLTCKQFFIKYGIECQPKNMALGSEVGISSSANGLNQDFSNLFDMNPDTSIEISGLASEYYIWMKFPHTIRLGTIIVYIANTAGLPIGTQIYTFENERLNKRRLCNTLDETSVYNFAVGCTDRHWYTGGLELYTENTDMAIAIQEIFVLLDENIVLNQDGDSIELSENTISGAPMNSPFDGFYNNAYSTATNIQATVKVLFPKPIYLGEVLIYKESSDELWGLTLELSDAGDTKNFYWCDMIQFPVEESKISFRGCAASIIPYASGIRLTSWSSIKLKEIEVYQGYNWALRQQANQITDETSKSKAWLAVDGCLECGNAETGRPSSNTYWWVKFPKKIAVNFVVVYGSGLHNCKIEVWKGAYLDSASGLVSCVSNMGDSPKNPFTSFCANVIPPSQTLSIEAPEPRAFSLQEVEVYA